jgi:hypothetical protein
MRAVPVLMPALRSLIPSATDCETLKPVWRNRATAASKSTNPA